MKKNILKIVILVLISAVLVLAIVLIVWKIKKSAELEASIATTTSQIQTPASTIEEQAAIRSEEAQKNTAAAGKTVEEFEKLQQQKNALEILKLMTEPQTTQEKETRDFLLGYDIDPTGKGFRLYNTSGTGYTLENYKVKECKPQDKTIVCTIEETRKYWNNVEGEWTAPQSKDYEVILLQLNGKWLIDKYKDPSSESDVDKYSGFGA